MLAIRTKLAKPSGFEKLIEHGSPLYPTDAPEPGTLERMFDALSKTSESIIGPANPHVLVIPIHDDNGTVRGGLWAWTMFEWLNISLLIIPESLQRRRIGTRLLQAAEAEARRRGCRGAQLTAFSFQAAGFYRKCGYTQFAELADLPPGHRQLYFAKRLDGAGS